MTTNFDKLSIFINRLKKLGIVIELFGNYPWIYLGKINGKNVTEKFEAEHGFTIAFLPIKPDKKLQFTELPLSLLNTVMQLPVFSISDFEMEIPKKGRRPYRQA